MNLGQWDLQPFVVVGLRDVHDSYPTRTDTIILRLITPTDWRMVNMVLRFRGRSRGLGACH